MKDTSNGYRVSFSYISSPADKPSLDSKKKIQSNPLATLELGGKKDNGSLVKIPERAYQTHRYVHSDQYFLKKDGWGIEAITTRKQIDNKMMKNMQTQGEILNLEQHSPKKNTSSNEISILQDEIRYLRQRLMQVENSQRALKLQFQLYKSNKQAGKDSTSSKKQLAPSTQKNKDEQRILMNEQLHQSQRKRNELQLKLEQQIKIKLQFINNNRQLTKLFQTKQEQFQNLKYKMEEIRHTLQLSQLERAKAAAKKQQQTQRNFTLQLERISQQNDRLNQLFQSQKNAKLFLQNQLKQKILQNNTLTVKIDQLNFDIQNRLKDIQFLNQQSYNLDMSLSNALQQLNYLKSQTDQSGQSKQAELKIKAAQQYIKSLQIKITQLQSQIQQAGIIINTLQGQYSGILRQLNQQVFIIQQFKQKNQQLQNQKLQVKLQKISHEQININSLCHIQDELFSLKAQNQQLRIQKVKLQDSQKLLIKQIEWIMNQKNEANAKIENKHKQETDALLLKIQQIKKNKEQQYIIFNSQLTRKLQELNEANLKNQQLIKGYEQSIKSNQSKCNFCESYPLVQFQKQIQSENSSDHTLSPNELKRHLMQLKKQSSISEEQNIKLREMLQTVEGQLQLSKINQNEEVKLVKQKYQRELQLSKEQYNMQLNFYIQEIQRLVTEMDKFKSKAKYCSSEVIQEEVQQENSMDLAKAEKVRKDLILYSQDPSDFYVSPPSDTPAKTSDQKGENYMLKDIIDLDQKINSYICNLNTKNQK